MTKPAEGEKRHIEEQQNKQKAISEKDLVMQWALISEMLASSVLLVGYISVYHIKNKFLNRKLKLSSLKPLVATNSKFELLMIYT